MANGPPQITPSTSCAVLPPTTDLFPQNPTQLWGGYPGANPRSAWSNFAPPPTGCVYGLDGSTRSWVPVVTRWEVMCMLEEQGQVSIGEAPGDGFDYVRNGLSHSWVNVQSLTFDGGTY